MRKRSVGSAGARLCALGATAVVLLAVFATSSEAAAPRFAAVRASVAPSQSLATGAFRTARMSVQVVLAPSHGARLQKLLSGLYNPNSASYRHFLTKGEFAKRFAPDHAVRAALVRYLRASGLAVGSSASPFLMRATGSSAVVSSAFRTNLMVYTNVKGIHYFSNASAVHLPAGLARGVLGVVGLTNTIRPHANALSPGSRVKLALGRGSGGNGCETGYPTINQLVTEFVDGGASPTLGYGGGPGCSGLTPSQDNSIYGAPRASSRTQGAGVNAAVFELSAYQHSDINTWARQFYGNGFNPPLVDVNVDGGPLKPKCPKGDDCPADANGYAGDIEVDADIEMTLAVSPSVRHVIVYNAPNDQTGQTSLDEYAAIAKQDVADTTSSSWGVCEEDVTAAYTQAENVLFEQMAAQGQSLFTSSGDSGAFGCLLTDGGTDAVIGDPGGQPWITDVGGTSFFNFNPGHDPNPGYGGETVWNPRGLCNTSADEFGGQRPRLVLQHRRRRRRRQPVLGPSGVPDRSGREQQVHNVRQQQDELHAGPQGHAVPRGPGHLAERRPVHAVLGVLHRQRIDARELLRHVRGRRRLLRDGSGSAAPASRRRSCRRSSPTATATPEAGPAMPTCSCTRCSTAGTPASTSTT